MVTRRCSERRYFLRPDYETNTNYLYCLAHAAEQAKVGVTFTVMLSNHAHTGINDHHGTYPVFLERFHSLLARCQNAHLGRLESFWSNEAPSVVWLVHGNDAVDKMVYAFSNPAASDLEVSIHDWPGAHSFKASLSGGTITVTRPKQFFRENGDMPETIDLKFERPIGCESFTPDDWNTLISDRVKEAELKHRDRRRAAGKNVLGRRRILAQSPLDCPRSHAPRFKINPRVAAKAKWPRIEALRRHKVFVESHRQVVQAILKGIHKVAEVVFPFGTYRWRKFCGAICESTPASSFDIPTTEVLA